MINYILYYVLTGLIVGASMSYLSYKFSKTYTTSDHVKMVILWPLVVIGFIIGFIKGFNKRGK